MSVLIIGASSLGRSAIHIARSSDIKDVIGFIDDNIAESTMVESAMCLGGIQILPRLFSEIGPFEIVIAIGDSSIRAKVYERIMNALPLIRLRTLTHPSARLVGDVKIGEGSIIFPGVVLGPSTDVGISTVINANATVGSGAKLGPFASLCPGVNLGSDCSLGKGVYVGMGAAIAQRITVGDWCTIGALSFVRNDVSAGVVATGIPASAMERQA